MILKKNPAIPIKAECHYLIKVIWNPKKSGDSQMAKAYKWLHENTTIKHFADENDYGKLFTARKALQAEAIRRGFLTIDDL